MGPNDRICRRESDRFSVVSVDLESLNRKAEVLFESTADSERHGLAGNLKRIGGHSVFDGQQISAKSAGRMRAPVEDRD